MTCARCVLNCINSISAIVGWRCKVSIMYTGWSKRNLRECCMMNEIKNVTRDSGHFALQLVAIERYQKGEQLRFYAL